MMKNARTWAMGASLAALGTLSITSVALAQGGLQQPHNCFCEVPAEDSCSGVKITASAHCNYPEEYCRCFSIPSNDPNDDCIQGVIASCPDTPAGS